MLLSDASAPSALAQMILPHVGVVGFALYRRHVLPVSRNLGRALPIELRQHRCC